MTTEEIILVKKSWKMLRGIDPAIIADTFYSKLFSQHPKLRSMFPTDMQAQYGKLIDMLNYIVHKLDSPSQLTEDISAMAQRHLAYGVRAGHYKLVGTALVWTLEKGLGRDWNAEVKSAWTSCYNMVAKTMIGEGFRDFEC